MPISTQIDTLLDEVRKRVFLLRGVRSFQEIAKEMEMTPITLRRWIKGETSIRPETLRTIEAWCDRQEGREHA